MSAPRSGHAGPGDLPCEGLSVVEVAVGTSDLGLGLAGGVPGMILGDLGADVRRVVGSDTPGIDRHLGWGRAWHRDKTIVTEDDPALIARMVREADVAIVYGGEDLVEGRGLGYVDVAAPNPALVYARCRPSRTAEGEIADYGLLVEARTGFCTQLGGHRPGPIFVDVRATGGGAALVLTASVLALLYQRARCERGGWSETSLYDGMLSTLGCMIGRSERAPVEVESYWQKGSTFPNFMYRCADDELLQVWFGGKGMYAKLIQVLGDEPSKDGYYAEQVSGALNERAARWRAVFARRVRDEWIDLLRAAGIACEPVLAPGDVLADPHVAEAGLVVQRADAGHREVMVKAPIVVGPLTDNGPPATPAEPGTNGQPARPLLAGLRVVDFSAFVAGPLAAQVLADLGADVIKVEPPQGEAMRAAAYAVAACQRGKRSLALDIGAPEARPVIELLLRRADVVLHNFRVGVSERLRVDERTVARLNPRAVYCHASAFGTTGPRAKFPGNDALMQALTGFESAVGGAGNDPIAGTWIPVDMCGGWVAAIGVLAGLYRATTTGAGQQVVTSLLGAGMLLQSGVITSDGRPLRQPQLDGEQTGYGPAYRIYRGSDGSWFALVVPAAAEWHRLREVPALAALPASYAPLRGGADDALAREAEAILSAAFEAAPAREWIEVLRSLGVLAEPVVEMDRDEFRRGILDDPVNQRLGRVASYATDDWGWFEQIGPLLRFGPLRGERPPFSLPGIGEHTLEVLAELGVDDEEAQALLAAKVASQN
ncbi:MAG TPA: CoA transferase [Acidimicrobiales bacterium]|nr:CoA transferase [Acidimicrobiales bacterium]